MRCVFVVVFVASVLAGCDAERIGPSGAMERAGSSTHNLGSVKVRTTMKGRLAGKPTHSRGSGILDLRAKRLWWTVTASVSGRETTVEFVAEENRIFSRLPGGTGWTVERRDGIAAITARLGSRDPASQLAMLAMVENVGRIGTETYDYSDARPKIEVPPLK